MKSDEICLENGSKISNPTPLEFRNLSDYPPPLEFYSPIEIERTKISNTTPSPRITNLTDYPPVEF